LFVLRAVDPDAAGGGTVEQDDGMQGIRVLGAAAAGLGLELHAEERTHLAGGRSPLLEIAHAARLEQFEEEGSSSGEAGRVCREIG
jgi:hypothetical protein